MLVEAGVQLLKLNDRAEQLFTVPAAVLWEERKLKEMRKGKKGTNPAEVEITVEESHG